MNIEIKSTSYLIPNNSSWESLHKDNKLKFAEYNNIFNNTKLNQKTECEIFVLFLKDIVDYYKVLKNIKKNDKLTVIAVNLNKNWTKPPSRYNYVSLLEKMEKLNK